MGWTAGRLGWILKLTAGLLLFYLAFRDVDPHALGRAFRAADPIWLALAALSTFITVAFVVLRWRVLLGATAEPRRHAVLFSAVLASQVANIVMPFKLGDAVRIGAVSRALAMPPAEVLGSVAVERLFDALLVAITAGVLVAAGTLPAFARAGLLWLAAAMVAALLTAAALVKFRAAAASAVRILPARIQAWTGRQIDLLLRGLVRVSHPSTAATAMLWSAAVMSGSILTAWLVLIACGLPVPPIAAAVVVIAVQIGGAVVPVPGAIGISQVVTVAVLRLWGINEASALAYALMLYLVSRVPKLAVLPFALSVLTGRTAAAR